MNHVLDFYFDFSSPYGYLASTRIEAIAQANGYSVNWHPVLLGAIFKTTGQQPLTQIPLKGQYGQHDFARSAREHDIPFRMPSRFPVATVSACRAFYWVQDRSLEAAAEPDAVIHFVHALFRAFYVDDRPIDDTATVLAIAQETGLDHDALDTALAGDALKVRLRQAMDAAIARGVFGSPMVFVGDEPFWGNDRLEQVHRWLSRGGW